MNVSASVAMSMSSREVEVVDHETAGLQCLSCDREVEIGQQVHVDRDSTGDDGSQVIVRVLHVVCPDEDAAA